MVNSWIINVMKELNIPEKAEDGSKDDLRKMLFIDGLNRFFYMAAEIYSEIDAETKFKICEVYLKHAKAAFRDEMSKHVNAKYN